MLLYLVTIRHHLINVGPQFAALYVNVTSFGKSMNWKRKQKMRHWES